MVTTSGDVGWEVGGTRAASVAGRRSTLLVMRFISCSGLSTSLASEPLRADTQETIDFAIKLQALRLSTELLAKPVGAGRVGFGAHDKLSWGTPGASNSSSALGVKGTH